MNRAVVFLLGIVAGMSVSAVIGYQVWQEKQTSHQLYREAAQEYVYSNIIFHQALLEALDAGDTEHMRVQLQKAIEMDGFLLD